MTDNELFSLDDDELHFPRASVDPRLLKLQLEVTEFVTGVILNHEKKFYELIEMHAKHLKSNILGTTNEKIIDMITVTTNTYYNQLYLCIQNKTPTSESELIEEISSYADYGSHVLLDKLIRLTIDIHHEIIREKLHIDTCNTHLKTVLEQINIYLISTNLLHILSKGPNDDIPFCIVPDNQQPFNISSKIVFEKNDEQI